MSKPEKIFQCGAVGASIFENEVQQNGKQFKVKKVSFQKRYKASDGWKSTNSLDVNDLPKAILVLQKAFEHFALSPEPTEGKDLEDGAGYKNFKKRGKKVETTIFNLLNPRRIWKKFVNS